jgi:hypothetical protein
VKEEVEGEASLLQMEMNPPIRIPRDITPDRLQELLQAHRNAIYSQVWPNLPRSDFGGKSAREASQDPKLRVPVMAAILNMELEADEHLSEQPFDFNDLRRDLGLPTRGTYSIKGVEFTSVSLANLSRVNLSELSNEELTDVFRLAALKFLRLAMRRSAIEIVARPDIAEKIDPEEVYHVLATVSVNTDESLQFIDAGRQLAVKNGHSPAQWYLAELQVRLSRYEGEECNRLTKLLTSRHAHEPGVNQALYQILVNHGVITPEGEVRDEGVRQAGAAGPLGPPDQAPATAAAESPGLWTPESAATKQESKLWLPGMP